MVAVVGEALHRLVAVADIVAAAEVVEVAEELAVNVLPHVGHEQQPEEPGEVELISEGHVGGLLQL